MGFSMRRLPLFLLLMLVVLQWPLWNGYWELFHSKKAIDGQQKVNQELLYRNAALQADIRDLKQGNDAVQERARLQLGMVKSDEVFVQVMDQPSALNVESAHATATPPAAAVAQAVPMSPAQAIPVKSDAAPPNPAVTPSAAVKP